MSGNKNVRGVHQPGTPKKGDPKPDANMPANNHGTYPVKLGSGQKSSFSSVGKGTSGQGGTNQTNRAGGANMPANNKTDKSVKLGHTKHGVGEVPGYLKNY